MAIYIASDHGGFELKKYLLNKFSEFEDLGPYEYSPQDDYTDYAVPLAQKVAGSDNKGILICRNGVGESIAANKIEGVRCGLSWDPEHAASARRDDDINVLALPADYIDTESAYSTVQAFLSTPASTEDRHIRRRAKLDQLDND